MIGLTPRQRAALDFLIANPRASLSDIAEGIGLSRGSKGYVSAHVLGNLERRGWIKRHRRRASHQYRTRSIQITQPVSYEARGQRFTFIPRGV